jgi:hypothetical protein
VQRNPQRVQRDARCGQRHVIRDHFRRDRLFGDEPDPRSGGPEPQIRIKPSPDEEGGDIAGKLDGRRVERSGGLEDGESGESLAVDLLRLKDGDHLAGELANLVRPSLLEKDDGEFERNKGCVVRNALVEEPLLCGLWLAFSGNDVQRIP